MSAGVTVAIIVVIVIIIAVAAVIAAASRRRRLRERFGPEYDRVVADQQSQRKAEAELASRERRVRNLDIRPLSRGSAHRVHRPVGQHPGAIRRPAGRGRGSGAAACHRRAQRPRLPHRGLRPDPGRPFRPACPQPRALPRRSFDQRVGSERLRLHRGSAPGNDPLPGHVRRSAHRRCRRAAGRCRARGHDDTPSDADAGITGEPAAEYGRSDEEYGRSDPAGQTRRR